MSDGVFYRRLLDAVLRDGRAAVISEYRWGACGAGGRRQDVPGGELVLKRIVGGQEGLLWEQVDAVAAHPDAQDFGPVTRLDSDDCLTIVERYTTKPRMIILGGGHIALALVHMAALADFETVVYDDRPSFANAGRFALAHTVICDGFDNLFKRVSIRATDFVVIVTRGHKHDTACLRGVLAGVEPMYVGMIGSRRRVGIVLEQLRGEGFAKERVARVHSPIGLPIKAVTPAEIAVSILAQVIEVRRGTQGESVLGSCDLGVVEALAVAGLEGFEALITIVGSAGSVPIGCGGKLAMSYEGATVGTVGGGCSEAEAMKLARGVIKRGGWLLHTIDLTDSAEEDGMVCGGTMDVVIERI